MQSFYVKIPHAGSKRFTTNLFLRFFENWYTAGSRPNNKGNLVRDLVLRIYTSAVECGLWRITYSWLRGVRTLLLSKHLLRAGKGGENPRMYAFHFPPNWNVRFIFSVSSIFCNLARFPTPFPPFPGDHGPIDQCDACMQCSEKNRCTYYIPLTSKLLWSWIFSLREFVFLPFFPADFVNCSGNNVKHLRTSTRTSCWTGDSFLRKVSDTKNTTKSLRTSYS